MADKYDKRGVSASKSEVHQAIAGLDKGLYPNAFCKILPDITSGDEDYVNLMHADTAGTKTVLSYLYWKEKNDLTVWSDVAQDALVMNLDDMGCVGAIDRILVSSTIGRNKHLIPGKVLTEIIQGTARFASKLSEYGVNLQLAGGETADVGDVVRTIDIGFTTFARLSKAELIVNAIRPGDVIIGLASYGQASYEDRYNSGIGSNGLTQARHDILDKRYENYPESFDPHTDAAYRFTGSYGLRDQVLLQGTTYEVGQLLLSPTRTYLPVLAALLNSSLRPSIHGIIHNTGGGLTKVMKFVDQCRIIKDQLLPVPPVFELIQQESNAPLKEMHQVFNMGQRLEIYIAESQINNCLDIIKDFNIDCQVIGHVESAATNELVITRGSDSWTYLPGEY
ncbi:MAG: phosphoribosylformylglycinamidine cyclo-ligase [Saprospiraceae bacterium]|nr:phosphoribosylformylglycinamidine cyclo-ligase [Saprospiraceae bacterium]MCB9319204.1 phosphoribosylformylglycinamidine cyclo-ligase [Lewinellaceae bacterium]